MLLIPIMKTENPQVTLQEDDNITHCPRTQPAAEVQDAQWEIQSYFFHALGIIGPCLDKQAFNSNLAAHLLINCKMSPGFHGKEEDVADM